MIVPYLASSLVNLSEPEKKSQFKLIKDHNSTKLNDFLINTSDQLLYIVICWFLETVIKASN